MYRRSTGKIIEVSDDLLDVKVKIPISYKNKIRIFEDRFLNIKGNMLCVNIFELQNQFLAYRCRLYKKMAPNSNFKNGRFTTGNVPNLPFFVKLVPLRTIPVSTPNTPHITRKPKLWTPQIHSPFAERSALQKVTGLHLL